MQAIQTKYLGPTNYKGSRVKATCAAKTITMEWNHEINSEENHRSAAYMLTSVLRWQVILASGHLKDGSFVHVIVK